MADRLIFEVFVEVVPEQITEITGESGSVSMIPFTGTVRGELFNGGIAPGGTDTQVVDADGVRHMSARYVLIGTDYTGQPCRIYVDNEGRFEDGVVPSPFHTIPTFLTDSPVLANRLHRNCFRGEGHPGANGPIIRFFEAN